MTEGEITRVTRFTRRCHNNRDVKELSQGSMCDYAPVETRILNVMDVVHQTNLVIHDE